MLTLLEQRQIEAGVLVPLIRAFQEEFGDEQTNALVKKVITGLAKERGAEIASLNEDEPVRVVRDCFGQFSTGGALELKVIQDTPEAFDVDVTRCKFADFYKEMGVPELGHLLSCHRDFAFTEGLSEDLILERNQTIMEGASRCDFRFRKRSKGTERLPRIRTDEEKEEKGPQGFGQTRKKREEAPG